MSHESFDKVIQSPHRTDLGVLTIKESSVVREWLNANAADKWFLLFTSNNVRVSFIEESDLIMFMLVKGDIVDSFTT